MKTPRPEKCGFTLVEVALSLGVVAIVALSLISMLGVALDSDRVAGRDTLLASMSSQVLGRLRAVPFDALWLAEPTLTPNPPMPGGTPPVDTTWYFSDDGVLLTDTTSGVPPGALFRCVVQKLPDDLSRVVPGTGPYHRAALKLQFAWPVSATAPAAKPPNLQVLHASIARY